MVSYTRGNDLSGSMEGAGGIGGLLARSSGYSGGNFTTHNYYFADGNGNVTYMLDYNLAMVASYRYDPFGNVISSSGTLASANVYRFSSKEVHANSGMYYYGHRFYDPNLQRWINRDPMGEPGFEALLLATDGSRLADFAELEEGPDLFAFVGNDSLNYYDDFGNGKRPSRNRNRKGHGSDGETKGGIRGDKHSRAKSHGGREKPNFKRAPGKGCRCGGVGMAVGFALDAMCQEIPDPEPPDDNGKCPFPGQTPVYHSFLFWEWTTCEPPVPMA